MKRVNFAAPVKFCSFYSRKPIFTTFEFSVGHMCICEMLDAINIDYNIEEIFMKNYYEKNNKIRKFIIDTRDRDSMLIYIEFRTMYDTENYMCLCRGITNVRQILAQFKNKIFFSF